MLNITKTLFVTFTIATFSTSLYAQQFKMIFDISTPIFGSSVGEESGVENTGNGEVFFVSEQTGLGLLDKNGDLVEKDLSGYNISGAVTSDLGVNNSNDKLYYLNERFALQYSISNLKNSIDNFGSADVDWSFGSNDGTADFKSLYVNENTNEILAGYLVNLDPGVFTDKVSKLTTSGNDSWTIEVPNVPWSVTSSPTGDTHLAGQFGQTNFLHDEDPYPEWDHIGRDYKTDTSLSGRNHVAFLSNNYRVMAGGAIQLRDTSDNIVWENDIINDSARDIVVSDDDSIFISGGSSVKELDSTTSSLSDSQREIWSYDIGVRTTAIDVDSHKNVYVSTTDNRVIKLNSEGKKVWEYNAGEGNDVDIWGVGVYEPD